MNHSRNKDYYECLAKLILENCFGESYPDLKLGDRPDLRTSNGRGIEVTQAMFYGAGETTGLFRMMKMKRIKEVPIQTIEAFERRGNKLFVRNGIICGYIPPAQWFSLSELQKCFKEKLTKIENYQGFEFVDLFVFSPVFEYYELEDVESFCGWCQTEQRDKVKQFDRVFVFDEPNIFRCDLKKGLVEKKECIDSLYHQCCENAKAFADANRE